MKAHLVQLDIAWEDPGANYESVRRLLDAADVAAGDLLVLPEMFDTGFSFNIERTNDKAGGTLRFLCELADDLGVTVQGGRTTAPCHRCVARNVMSVLAPGDKLLAEYVKIHPFQREAERFEAGRDVVTYPWGGLTVCPAICYDLRFPELFRLGARRGAEVFALGACWPIARAHHWRALVIARAIENQAYMLGVNRSGKDPMLLYGGGTIAVSPRGDVLGELGDAPGVLSVDVDPAAVRDWRAAFPALRDAKLLDALCFPPAPAQSPAPVPTPAPAPHT
jgi:predicted amidohydrolase